MDVPLRVLIIDDDPDVRTTTQWLLEDAGFSVSTAPNGQLGLQLQQAEPADVVVTDIYMPDKDGIETIAEFHDQFPHVPIIVVSGGGSVGSSQGLFVARELGVHKVLVKPVDPRKLVDAVREASSAAPQD
jgi:DNA-binding response OmpR family regulator